jgi:phage gpG-like protein
MIILKMKPWKPLTVLKRNDIIGDFLETLGKSVENTFKKGMNSPKSGRYYGSHRASASGEYPARRTSALYKSVDSKVTESQVEIGTNKPYSIYLAAGTSKMAKRKMSKEALLETTSVKLPPWVRFST